MNLMFTLFNALVIKKWFVTVQILSRFWLTSDWSLQSHVQQTCLWLATRLQKPGARSSSHVLLRFPGWTILVSVSKISAQSAATYINHAVLKRPLAQWVQVKSFNMCPLQLGIHNNWKYKNTWLSLKCYSNRAYLHDDDDDEFVSKCN